MTSSADGAARYLFFLSLVEIYNRASLLLCTAGDVRSGRETRRVSLRIFLTSLRLYGRHKEEKTRSFMIFRLFRRSRGYFLGNDRRRAAVLPFYFLDPKGWKERVR